MVYSPKTDWKYEDVINYQDFERMHAIKQYLIRRIMERLGRDGFEIRPNGLNSYESLGYASEINRIEQNLEAIILGAGQEALDYLIKSWPDEEKNPDFEDVNRWEQMLLDIKNTIYATSLFHPRCGVFRCGQKKHWQVRYRNLPGLMWNEFEEYEMNWNEFDDQDITFNNRDYQAL